MKLRRTLFVFALLIAAVSFVAGCGKKADDTAGTATSDSLLSTNPIEQPQGGIEPQTGVQAGTPAPEQAAPSTPTPAPNKPARKPSGGTKTPAPATATIASGTPIKISMDVALDTKTAHEGDSWSGTVKDAVTVGSAAPFPAGSVVHGVVTGVMSAERGSRAYFVLRITSIDANGASHELSATADSMIAGSTRKRNVGAIAGSAAAGALLGRAIGGSGKGAVIGGVLGGAAATGAVAASKGFQVEIPVGKEIVFHVDNDTKVRL